MLGCQQFNPQISLNIYWCFLELFCGSVYLKIIYQISRKKIYSMSMDCKIYSCRIFYDTQRLNNAWNALINSLWYCMFFILHENLIPRFFCIMSIRNDIKPPKPLFLINRKSHKLSESNCEISKSAQVRLAILQYFILSSRLITNLQ